MRLILIFTIFLSAFAFAQTDVIGHMGRIVNADGSPVAGPSDLTFELHYSNDLTSTGLECDLTINSVPLVNGIYNVKLDFDSNGCDLENVIKNIPSGETLVMRVKDNTAGLTFDWQNVLATPMSYRAKSAASADNAKGVDDGIITAAKLDSMGAGSGQVLKWNGSAWAPSTDNTGIGTVTSVSAGAGLVDNSGSGSDPVLDVNVDDSTLEISGDTVQVKDLGITPAKIPFNAQHFDSSNTTSLNLFLNPTGGLAATIAGLGLSTTGVTAGTYTEVTVDAQGRITSAGTLDESDLPNAEELLTACDDDDILKASGGSFVCAPMNAAGQWSVNGSDIFFNTGFVGIGTNAPTSTLHVVQTSDDSAGGIRLAESSGANSSVVYREAGLGGAFVFQNQGSDTLSIKDNKVGVGTLDPQSSLDVVGTIRATEICDESGANCRDLSTAAAAGDITGVAVTAPLTGGGSTGDVSLGIDYDNSTIGLNGSNALEVKDNSITDTKLASGISGSKITTGTIPNSVLNTGVGANQLVVLDGSSMLPGVDGSQLINLPSDASKVDKTTTVNGQALSGNVSLDTDDITEGASNKYFTDLLAKTAAIVNNTAGSETDQAASVAAMKTYVTTQIGTVQEGVWTESGSDISYTAGNVGIGVSNPSEPLEVIGKIKATSLELSGNFDSPDHFNKNFSLATFATGDYFEMVRANPQDAGVSGMWEVYVSATRGSWTEGHTYLVATGHSQSVEWREAVQVSENLYTGDATTKCLTLDVNGNGSDPEFRLRALKDIASCGVSGSLTGRIKIRAIGKNVDWTDLSDTGSDLTVSKYQPTGASFNILTGNPRAGSTSPSTLTSTIDGDIGIGTQSPSEKLEVAGNVKATAYYGDGSNLTGITSDSSANNTDAVINADADSNTSGSILFQTGGTTKAIITNDGKLGIGNTSPSAALDVSGVAVAGTNATTGGLQFAGKYGSGYLNTYGSEYSTGATAIGYAVKPKVGATGFVSSSGAASFNRGAVLLNNEFEFLNAPSSTTSVDDDIAMTSRFKVSSNGNVGIGNDNPASKLYITQSSDTGHSGIRLENSAATAAFGIYVDATGKTHFGGPASSPDAITLQNSDGHVGIGTDTPGARLEVKGTTTEATPLLINRNSSANVSIGFKNLDDQFYLGMSDTEDFAIGPAQDLNSAGTYLTVQKTTGNVGVGTVSPTERLEVSGNIIASNMGLAVPSGNSLNSNALPAGLYKTNTSTVGSAIPAESGAVLNMQSGVASGAVGQLQIKANNTEIPEAFIRHSDNAGDFKPWYKLVMENDSGNVGIGVDAPSEKLTVVGDAARIRLEAVTGDLADSNSIDFAETNNATHFRIGYDGTVNGPSDGKLKFSSPQSAVEDILVLDRTGLVGIGTDTPNRALEVVSSDGTPLRVQGSGVDSQIAFSHSGVENAGINASDDGALEFRAGGISNSDEMMRITSGGNVGIGTITPGSKLEVAGKVTADTFFTKSNSITVPAAGWYRLAELNGAAGRGECELSIYTAGGSFNPTSSTIRFHNNYSNVAHIWIESTGNSNYWPEARVTNDGSKSYLELNFNSDMDNGLHVRQGLSLGLSGCSLYSGALPAGGDTVHKTVKNGLSTVDEDFIVASNGNVGVGTQAPSEKLEVSGNVKATAFYGDGSNITGITSEASSNAVNAVINADSDANSSGEIQFQTGGSTKAVLANDGKFGLGVGAPKSALHVASSEATYATNLADTIDKSAFTLKTHSTDSTITTMGGLSGGAGYIQRSNGTGNTTYPLLLNPFGGNVGIGTDSPAHRLHVEGGSVMFSRDSDPLVRIENSGDNTAVRNASLVFRHSNGDGAQIVGKRPASQDDGMDLRFLTQNAAGTMSEKMTITEDGEVGIGTNNPTEKLTLDGGNFAIKREDNYPIVHVNGYGYTPHFIGKMANGTFAAPTATTSGNVLSIFRGIGYGATGFGSGTGAAQISIVAAENFTDTNMPGELVFSTANTGTVSAGERMRITKNGKVGIGVSDPDGKLSIEHPGTIGGNSSNEGNSAIKISSADEATYSLLIDSNEIFQGGDKLNLSGENGIVFSTGDEASANRAERMRLLPNGNFGIGTDNPVDKFTVKGDGASLRIEASTENIADSGRIIFAENDTTDHAFIRYNGSAGIPGSGGIILGGSSTDTLAVTRSGLVGIGTNVPASKLHIVDQDAGSPSEHGIFVVESEDAQMDLISTNADQWGSGINFVETDQTTKATVDIWSIVRQAGESGNSSLNFNYGTVNNHGNDTKVSISTAGNLGVGVSDPAMKLEVGDVFKVDTASNKIIQDNMVSYSGRMATASDYPTCVAPARIYDIGVINSGASGQGFNYIELEITGSHRGYNASTYYERKKYVLSIGDKVSSQLIESAGSGSRVSLWDGSATGDYNNLDAAGRSIQLLVNPGCGSSRQYTVNVRYTKALDFTPATRTASNFPYVDHSQVSEGLNTNMNLNAKVGIGVPNPSERLEVAGRVVASSVREQWTVTTVADDGATLALGANVMVDVSGGAYSLTLPASPVMGDVVKFVHAAGNLATNNLTINPGAGDTIVTDTDLVLDVDNLSIELIFFDADGDGDGDWRLF